MSQTTDLEQTTWDAIVVGSGMGGATLGYALAKGGWRVLFCEQGDSHLGEAAALRGGYPEMTFAGRKAPRPEHAESLRRAGRATLGLEDRSGPRPRRFLPFVGAGSGGSSALYGMALERFFPEDFAPRAKHPDAADSSLPARWPISYQDLAPYYQAAEALYRVRGGGDPLRGPEASGALGPAPALSPANQAMAAYLEGQGLHPYRLPSACEFVAGCRGCQGYLCAKACKNDSARVCLAPALEAHGAQLLARCQVLSLSASGREVSGVNCRWAGRALCLRGRVVVLAAGALNSPAILLRSRSDQWPDGLANGSGLVGRNLMRHLVDLYALAAKPAPGPEENPKEIAFNDLYGRAGGAYGSVQSFGRLPPAPMLVDALQDEIRGSAGALSAGLFGAVKPLLRPVLARKFAGSLILASLLEDLPYEDNRVAPAGADADGGLVLEYRLRPYETQRIAALRGRLAALFKPHRPSLLKQAENNERLAHACGTCRFGEDPAESVLDAMNRAHGLDNLYVVDSSFFPSSGGTNPSLTIAANALRVADGLLGKPAAERAADGTSNDKEAAYTHDA